LAEYAHTHLQKNHPETELIDLKDYPIPLCDGDQAYSNPNVGILRQKIQDAKGILLASSIYNYDLNASAKNLVEVTGKAWSEKIIGLMAAAGGKGSFMAPMMFANSLILDFRCVLIPRYVYATGDAFDSGKLIDEEIQKRTKLVSDELVRFVRGLMESCDG
jgi:FMN reductase